MATICNKIIQLLIDARKSPSQVVTEAGVSRNIITKMRCDDYISIKSTEKTYKSLN